MPQLPRSHNGDEPALNQRRRTLPETQQHSERHRLLKLEEEAEEQKKKKTNKQNKQNKKNKEEGSTKMPNGAPTDFDLTYLRGASFPLGLCYFILGAIFLSQQTLFSCPKTLCGKGKFVMLGQQAHLRFFHASMTLCCIIRFSSFAAISVFEISGLLDTGIDSSGNNEVQEYTWQGKLFTNAFTVMFNMPDIITVCTYLLLVLIFAEVYQESRLHLFDSLDFRRKWLYGYIVLVMVFFGSQIILFVLLFSVDDSGGGLQLSVYLFVTACNIIVVIMFVAFSIYLSVTFSGYPYKGEIQRERLQKVGSVVNWWTAGRVLWGLTTLTSSSEPWLAMLPAWASPMVITGALVMSEVLPFSWVLYGNFYSMLAIDASQSYAGGAGESGTLLWQPTAEQADINDDHSDNNSVDVEARYDGLSVANSVSSRRHSSMSQSSGVPNVSGNNGKREPLSSNSSAVSVASPGASHNLLRANGGGGVANKDTAISLPVRLLFQNDFDMRSVEQIVMEATNTLPSPVMQRFRVVCAKKPYRGREVLMKKIAIPPTTSAAIKKEFVRRLLDIHTRLRNCKESRTRALFTPVHGFVLQAQSIVMVEDLEPEAITLFHFIMKSKNHGSSIDLASMDGASETGHARHSATEQPLLDVASESLGQSAAGSRWPLYKCIAVARDLMAGICQLHELKMYHGYFSVFSVTVNEVTEAVHLSDAGLAAVLHFAHHQLVYKQVRRAFWWNLCSYTLS